MFSQEIIEIVETEPMETNQKWYTNSDICFLKEGYDSERFVEPPRKDFVCPICLGVVREPLECTQCGTLICKKCTYTCGISQNPFFGTSPISPKFNCPICRSRTCPRDPSNILKKLINSMMIYCKNKANACPENFPLGEIKKHEKICKFKTIKCANHNLCKHTGEKNDFIQVEFVASSKNEAKVKMVCSEICKKVVTMEYLLRTDQTEKAIYEYSIALDSLNNIQK